MLAGVDGRRRFERGRGRVQPLQMRRKEQGAAGGVAGPLGQLERMVFSIQELYLQI